MLIVSHFAKNLGLDHFRAVNLFMKYLAGSLEKGIIFGEEFELQLGNYLNFD